MSESKPRAYHASNLSLVARHCPRSLDYYEARVTVDRSIFQAGIAAHAVAEAVGNQANKVGRALTDDEARDVGQQVALQLCTVGRSYDRVPEPPMQAEQAFAGRDLFLDWHLFNPIEPGAQFEVGLALDAKGSPVPYHADDARLLTILDVVRIAEESDEETSKTVLTVTDYKSSWAAGDSELDTLQRKLQAVLAMKYFGAGVDMLRLEVVNLRLQKTYSRELYVEDGLRELLSSWLRDVLTAAAALDEQKRIGRGKRPATPGACCCGCPYLSHCEEAMNFYELRGPFRTAERRATAYAVATAMRDELGELLRLDTDEGPIEIEGGIIGTVAKVTRETVPDVHELVWDAWESGGGETLGLLKSLKLTTGNVANMAKVLYADRKERADREALIQSLTQETTKREFGIHPKPQQTTQGEQKGANE